MASRFSISTTVLLLLFLIAFINTVVITAVPEREYYSMIASLRYRGYHLFANAITTTDLHYDILSGTNFTFFAPIDSALYDFDMKMSAADYTMALRFHGVPHRLTLPELRMLPYGLNSFPTLVHGHEIHIVNRLAPIMVEGVNIALPGLFYGSNIAVHGLEGIIDFRDLTDPGNSTLNLPGDVTSNSSSDPVYQSINTNLTNDRQAFTPSPSPIPSSSPFLSPFPSSSPSPSPQSPLDENSMISAPMAAESPLTSNLTRISTIESPVPAPQTSLVSSLDTIPETNSASISLDPWNPDEQPMTYSESITQGNEEHMSMATRPTLVQQINDVSLLATTRSSTGNDVEEFTQVDDDKILDCPDFTEDDDDGKQLNNIANVRHGDLYTRELYTDTPSNMTCA